MLRKKPNILSTLFANPSYRLGIVFVALVISFAIISVSLSGPAGIFSTTSRSYAQASSSIFGVESNPLSVAGGLNWITQTQTAWVRGPVVHWNEIEITPGTYNWSNLGDVILELQAAVSNGFEPVVVVNGTPTWAQKVAGYSCGPIESTQFTAFGNFIAAMLTSPSSPLAPLNIQYVELWNEPDLSWNSATRPDSPYVGCWGEEGDTLYYGGSYYGEMLKAVYPLIKAADSQVQVLVGGLLLDCDPDQPPSGMDCTSSKFLEGILVNNGGAAFDGISYHAYDYYGGVSGTYANTNWNASWNNDGPSLIRKSDYLKNLLHKYNVTGKYLLNTEDALLCDTCSNDPAFENTKAYYLAEAYAGAMAQNLRANIWFSVLGEWGRHNGLLDITTSGYPPLPAYFAYQFGAQELDGASYVGKITNFPGVAGYEFSKGDRHVWLMWVPDGSSVTVDLRATPLDVFDVDGDPVAPSGNQLVLRREPYYVELPLSLPRLHLPIMSLKAYASIPNGDFEEGQSDWIFANNGLPVSLVSTNQLDPNTPAGKVSVLLGNPDYPCLGVPIGYAEVSGTVLVPTHPNENVWLDFDYIIYSQDALSGTGAFDRFEVNVLGSADPAFFDGNLFNQNLIACQYQRVPGPENLRENMTTGWAHGSLDLSKYQGQVITIYFRNYNRPDNFYNTYTILDNIRIR